MPRTPTELPARQARRGAYTLDARYVTALLICRHKDYAAAFHPAQLSIRAEPNREHDAATTADAANRRTDHSAYSSTSSRPFFAFSLIYSRIRPQNYRATRRDAAFQTAAKKRFALFFFAGARPPLFGRHAQQQA